MTTWTEQTIREAIRVTQDGEIRVTQSGEVRVCMTGAPQAWPVEGENSTAWTVQSLAVDPWVEE